MDKDNKVLVLGIYKIKGGEAMRVNIEAERARLQLTKAQMSKALGISRDTYSNYIKGSKIPSDVLELLHEMTGRSIDYLLGLVNDKRNSA